METNKNPASPARLLQAAGEGPAVPGLLSALAGLGAGRPGRVLRAPLSVWPRVPAVCTREQGTVGALPGAPAEDVVGRALHLLDGHVAGIGQLLGGGLEEPGILSKLPQSF